MTGVFRSFDLNCGEKRPRKDRASHLLQSVRQSVFDGFPVGSGEVGLELEKGRNVFHTVGERRERNFKNQQFNPVLH